MSTGSDEEMKVPVRIRVNVLYHLLFIFACIFFANLTGLFFNFMIFDDLDHLFIYQNPGLERFPLSALGWVSGRPLYESIIMPLTHYFINGDVDQGLSNYLLWCILLNFLAAALIYLSIRRTKITSWQAALITGFLFTIPAFVYNQIYLIHTFIVFPILLSLLAFYFGFLLPRKEPRRWKQQAYRLLAIFMILLANATYQSPIFISLALLSFFTLADREEKSWARTREYGIFLAIFAFSNILYVTIWKLAGLWTGNAMGYKSSAALSPQAWFTTLKRLVSGGYNEIFSLTYYYNYFWFGVVLICIAALIWANRNRSTLREPHTYTRLGLLFIAVAMCVYPLLIDGQRRTGIGLIVTFYFLVCLALIEIWNLAKPKIPADLIEPIGIILVTMLFFSQIYFASRQYHTEYEYGGKKNEYIRAVLMHEDLEKYKRIAVKRELELYYKIPRYNYTEIYMALVSLGYNPAQWQIELVDDAAASQPADDTLVIDMNQFQKYYEREKTRFTFYDLNIYPQNPTIPARVFSQVAGRKGKSILFLTVIGMIGIVVTRHLLIKGTCDETKML